MNIQAWSRGERFWVKLCPALLTGFLLSAFWGRVEAASCVVLQYHHFSDKTPAATSISPSLFQQQLDYLESHNFKVLPLVEVIEALRNKRDLPDKCAALTVDDAYTSVYQNAFPMVRKKGWSMSVFVSTDHVGNGKGAYMSWEQMREMAQQGVSIENHGKSHDHLVRYLPGESEEAWRARVTADISTAQEVIARELGTAPSLFAYPYGEYTPAVQEIVRSLGLVAFGQNSGAIWEGSDFTALSRFPMAAQYAAMPGFITKANSLALPVLESLPKETLLGLEERRPLLTLRFAPDLKARKGLQCFVNGSKDVTMRWTDTENQVSVQPNFNLSAGRSRTNCTLASGEAGRFYWYSHDWIRRRDDGSWYIEY